jgi:hypothetical protein
VFKCSAAILICRPLNTPLIADMIFKGEVGGPFGEMSGLFGEFLGTERDSVTYSDGDSPSASMRSTGAWAPTTSYWRGLELQQKPRCAALRHACADR